MSRWMRESWEPPPLVEVTDEDGSKRLCAASLLATPPCETLDKLHEACRIVQQRLIDHESSGMLASSTVCVNELWDAAVKMDRATPIPTRPRFPEIDCDKPTPKTLANDVIESLNLLRDWAFAEKKAQTGTGGPGEGGQGGTEPVDNGKQKHGNSKKSTFRGEARAKIISALSMHHKYENGQCDKSTGPIVSNKLARQADVGKASVTRFFQGEFPDGGRTEYNRTCGNYDQLVRFLQRLNDESLPPRTHSLKPDMYEGDAPDKYEG